MTTTPAPSENDVRHLSAHTTTPDHALKVYDDARARCPVAHSEEHGGFHLMLDHATVRATAADHRRFSSEPQVLRPILPRESLAALEMDPPRHGDWRALFDQAVTPHVVKVMEPLVRRDVNRHIDALVAEDGGDLVTGLSEMVPAEAICRLMGIDDELVPEVRDRAVAMLGALGDPAEFPAKLQRFAEISLTEIGKRKEAPRDDFLTYLTTAKVDGELVDDEGYIAVLTGFLGAGHHTTTSGISSLVLEVFGRPDVRAQLLADPSLVPIAVEEALRLRPPFFGFFRRATVDSSVAGVDIAAGDDVYLGWAAANRDPSMFECPSEFRLDRGRNRHLTFGSGLHTCPGAPLARMELRVCLEELLRRVPDLELDTRSSEYLFAGGDYASVTTLPARFPRRDDAR
ncbi:cytochrome P450 [Rhodococcus sp. BP-288]|uniref:cytochrome P450 n=1 Tax=Rhodococcus sp. BP-288 TaxID=2739444 RepID=UPI001C9A9A70|nr:cytochrome P450 [Rhodococcus sp. BP-288]MBY6685593.1 cytochrome P450 [Rhodococcus sp. BP-288]